MELENSIVTFNLNQKNAFLSIFSNCFVFGFADDKYFTIFLKFDVTELKLFYVTMRKCITFLTLEDNECENTNIKDIIKRFKNNDIVYYMTQTFENAVKTCMFLIENKTIVQQIDINLDFIDSIFRAISYGYFSIYKISNTQKFFLSFCSSLSEDDLKACKNSLKSFLVIFKQFEKEIHVKRKYELHQLLHYYYEDIIIINEIKLLST